MDSPPSAPPSAPASRWAHPGVLAMVLAVVALVVGVSVPFSAAAQTSDDAAQRAAREIQDARDRANAAAEAFFRSEADLELLEDELAALELETEQLQTTVEQLRLDVEAIALARFVNSGASGIPLLTGLQAPQDQVQAEVFSNVLTNTGNDALDQYDIAQKDLVETESKLSARQQDLEQQRVTYDRLRDDALAEVERLRAVEEQRLRDEAVRRALEAQQAEERARLEQLARQRAEAAAQAQPNPAAAQSSQSTSSGSSGGSSGGRTGTTGSGSQSSGGYSGGAYVDNIACPLPGSAYGDTWGAPRSGGRRHQGVDMIAPMGAPIYAVTNGSISYSQNSLGGNAAWLTGSNGNRYYYAHMSSYEGSNRSVQRGEVIAYNGDSGNATGVPHLHFEILPGGGVAVNPTPSVRAAGC